VDAILGNYMEHCVGNHSKRDQQQKNAREQPEPIKQGVTIGQIIFLLEDRHCLFHSIEFLAERIPHLVQSPTQLDSIPDSSRFIIIVLELIGYLGLL
jgi:hypothetical protein